MARYTVQGQMVSAFTVHTRRWVGKDMKDVTFHYVPSKLGVRPLIPVLIKSLRLYNRVIYFKGFFPVLMGSLQGHRAI